MAETDYEKLERFVKSANAEVENKIKLSFEDAEKLSARNLENTENECIYREYERIKLKVKEIDDDYKHRYAKLSLDYKNGMLTHRERLVDSIFKDIEQKLDDFTELPVYQGYLKNLLRNEEINSEIIVYMSERDVKMYGEELSGIYDCKFEKDDFIKIGGLSIYNPQQQLLIDKTIDTSLAQQRKDFSVNYSLGEV